VGDLKRRVLAAAVLAPFIIIFFIFLPAKWFFGFTTLIGLFAVYESTTMAGGKDRFIIIFISALCILPLYQRNLTGFVFWTLFSPVVYFMAKFFKGDTNKGDASNEIIRGISILLLCEYFIMLPVYCLYFLKEMGRYFPLILLLSLWASDTCAYFFGKSFGKRLMTPIISPKKTYEGLLGAVLGSLAVIMISGKYLGMGFMESLIIGAIIGILGQIGDILESAGKRFCGVKDSSSLIPGHGGILDRIDSFIFTAPFMYYYISGIRV